MATREGQFAPELLLRLEQGKPLRGQIERQLREGIRSGRLLPHTELPSTRALAAELGVSRGVVVEAYDQLRAEGYLYTRQGSRTRVAPATGVAAPTPQRVPRGPRIRFDFRPGIPELASFPRAAWIASTRRALRAVPDEELAYGDPRGVRALRGVLAAYLGRVRGAAAEPSRLVVCAGVTEGIGLACRALAAGGARRIAVEDPGFFIHRETIARSGLEPVPVPVDAGGLDVGRLSLAPVDAVLVTPAHQMPTGVVLAPERRAALLAWAEQRDGIVLEDDYDAEYRYDREPVGALQGLAPERVVYIGSTSKSLAPALRLGWVHVPARLLDAVREEKLWSAMAAPIVDQVTFADFVERGDLDRHLRRTRRRYRSRRDALVDALARHLPEAEVTGVAAGLHALVHLPDGTDEDALAAAAAQQGLAFGTYASHHVRAASRPGLVLGYANLPEPTIERGVELLAEVLAAVGRS